MVRRPCFRGYRRDLRNASSQRYSTFRCGFFPVAQSDSQTGKQVVFVTNNSTKSRADYQNKLKSMGIPAEIVGLLPVNSYPYSPLKPSKYT